MGRKQLVANRYEITGVLGQGGMGDVYRGVDVETGDTVAIKLLKPDIVDSDPSLIERFTREGEALRQLNHPGIVKILASIEEDDMHYLVMEYVPGGSLLDALEAKLPVERVLAIALELADALTRAHHLHIIHRDLKPANVLLAEDGTPRLTDFGVAQIGGRTRVTETGSVVGTYYYLSPEACRGEDLDQRTDVWSFGVMLYEMLSGQHPFEGEHSAAILVSILNNPTPDLTQLRPDVPPAVIDLIRQMLEKDRDQRIPSMRQVGAALEAIIQGTPNLSRFATPPPPANPASVSDSAPASRRHWWLAGIAAVLAALALVIVLTSGGSDSDGAQIPLVPTVEPGTFMVLVAELEPLGGVVERDAARFIVEDLRDHLEKEVPFSTLRVRAYPDIIRSEEDAQTVAEANKAAVVVWGNYTPEFVEVEIQLGSMDAFPNMRFDRATIAGIVNVRVHMTNERRESVVSPVLTVLNVLQTAEGDGFEVSRTIAVLDALDVTHAEIVSGGAAGYLQRSVLLYLDNTEQAVEGYTRALDAAPGNALLYAFRTAGSLRVGDVDQALRDNQTAQRLGPDGWTTPPYLWALYSTSLGDYDAALTYVERIIRQRPNDWFSAAYHGGLYYLRGEYDLAQAELQRAVDLGAAANFPYIPLSMIALRAGDLAQAQQYWNIIVTRYPDTAFSSRLSNALYGDQFPVIFGPLFEMAGSLMLGQYEAVIQNAERALASDDGLVDIYLAEGLAYCNQQDYAAAEAAYTRGIELEPDYMLLVALRADVRRQQQVLSGAADDLATLRRSSQADQFMPLVQGGEWDCTRFLTYAYAGLDNQ